MSENTITTPVEYVCCLCQKKSEDESLFVLTIYITPMCKRCHGEGSSYGWD